MRLLSWEDLLIGWAPKSVRFWRCMAIAFCAFSLLGHWMEIPYCLFNDWLFDIVDDDSGVWDIWTPFFVYGFAAVLAAVVLVPYRQWLVVHRSSVARAVLEFYILAVLASMAGELIQGFIQNQPDPVTGEYPLWDNSELPLNILGQAWLVNDILLGAVVTLYVWVLYPLLVKFVNLFPEKWGWPITITVVAAFLVLCYFTVWSVPPE